MSSGQIPVPSGDYESSSAIPANAAIISSDTESPEALPFNLSFAKYNPKECQIESMNGDNAKATLDVLRDVGLNFSGINAYKSCAKSGVEVKHVNNDGDYTNLYRGIDDDVKEIKYVNKNKNADIRIFFCTLEKERLFYIIAARCTHIDTSKGSNVRRSRKNHQISKRWR